MLDEPYICGIHRFTHWVGRVGKGDMTVNFWAAARFPRQFSDTAPSATDSDPQGVRSIYQQDYDRLLFSTPVRRLADKTQVWPMEENDGVRTRLTHSHEVANLARSIGARAYTRAEEYFSGANFGTVIQPILQAIGLAHDLGNPPFGHQGETAIGDWFKVRKDWIFTKEDQKSDADLEDPVPKNLWEEFTEFDGNPQTLRLLVNLQTHQARVGLDLTAATLSAVLKYPVHVTNREQSGVNTRAQAKKGGYFESEFHVVEWLRKETGLREGQRHPLTWIMEACDDIAYSVLDVDDLLKKSVLSPDDVLVTLRHSSCVKEDPAVTKLVNKFREVNNGDRHVEIQRDIKIQYLRAYMIEALINEASDEFVKNVGLIMKLKQITALMENSSLCNALKGIAKQYGLRHPKVLLAEATGAAAIDGLMTALWNAISKRKEKDDLRSKRITARDRYIFSLISPNYIEQAETSSQRSRQANNLRYRELRLLTDMVSGMTDTFAINLWRSIREVPDVDCT